MKLNKLNIMMDRYNNMKEARSIVSHEMRTPLNNIVQLIDCIKHYSNMGEETRT